MCSVLRLLLVWLILDALLLTGVSRRHTRRRPGLPVCSFFLRHSLSPLRLTLKYIKASGNWTSMICMFSLKVVALVDDPCLATAFAQIITSSTRLEDQIKPWSHQLVWDKVRFITLRFLSFNGILVPGYTLISNSLGLGLVAYKPFVSFSRAIYENEDLYAEALRFYSSPTVEDICLPATICSENKVPNNILWLPCQNVSLDYCMAYHPFYVDSLLFADWYVWNHQHGNM